jgi:hypothetical protein
MNKAAPSSLVVAAGEWQCKKEIQSHLRHLLIRLWQTPRAESQKSNTLRESEVFQDGITCAMVVGSRGPPRPKAKRAPRRNTE